MYFQNFYAFRFLAALAIVVLHVELMGIRFGWRLVPLGELLKLLSLGVDFFFVLSGFLITGLLLKELDQDQIRISRFYKRRGLRILPLYFLVVLCVFVVVPLIGLPEVAGLSLEKGFDLQMGLHLGLLPQVAKSFLPFVPYGGQLWSVGVEIMFYMLWPLLLAWRSTRCFVVVFILSLIGIKAVAVLTLGSENSICTFLAMSRFEVLAIGGLASMVHRDTASRGARGSKWDSIMVWSFQSVWRWLGALAVLSVLTMVSWRWFDDVVHIVCGVLFAVLLLGSAYGLMDSKYLESRVVKFLGEISYGIYVWHFIAIGVIQIIVMKLEITVGDVGFRMVFYLGTFLITFVISAASYLIIEKPLNQLRHRL
jgi:peptidoglycan/LPS O-acetylase OafA/YrhL